MIVCSAVDIMTPLLLAATGGLFTELAGMLNIALEGLMLTAAFAAVVAASACQSLLAGLAVGILSSLALALLFGAVTLRLKANLFITGLAVNLLASGLTAVLSLRIFGSKGVILLEASSRLPALRLPGLEPLPLVGELLSGHNPFVYLSWVLLALSALILYQTPLGLRLRGAGKDPQTLVSLGLKPERYQLLAILFSGLSCGIAGSLLSLRLGAFVPNITAGRGWIALVAIYLGNRTPLGLLVAAFLFALAEAAANYAQGVLGVPTNFILAFPYLVTVLAMILYSVLRRRGR